ncbi:Teichoic acids export ATP-binding protein TagH [bacterium HR37]|nr:Teichoic acids export ATP-binding protein TagH [bacterium HR37]
MSKVLILESVSKSFSVQRNRPLTIRELLVQSLLGRESKKHTVWALRDISFSVRQGEVLGIIGHNGAGKSTLLRLISGVSYPTRGCIKRFGRIGSLLELGTGFHPDMTGRENLLTAGILNGLTSRQVKMLEEEIVEFSELREFIDQPVRTYSSGMYLRLAFSVAIHFDPDILVVDEVLAVGDLRFQQKCLERFRAFKNAGKTLVFTSHSIDQVKNLCDEVVVLEEGRMVMKGDPQNAIDCYNELMRERTERQKARVFGKVEEQAVLAGKRGKRLGTHEAVITDVCFYDTRGRAISGLGSGEGLTVELKYRIVKPVGDLALILGIYDEGNTKCFETHIPSFRETFGFLGKQGSIFCSIPELPLLPGRYYLNLGLYPPDWNYVYDYHWQMHGIDVVGKRLPHASGIVSLNLVWSACNGNEDVAGR